jgi:hypothetical protein
MRDLVMHLSSRTIAGFLGVLTIVYAICAATLTKTITPVHVCMVTYRIHQVLLSTIGTARDCLRGNIQLFGIR